MAEWDCAIKTLGIQEWVDHTKTSQDGEESYGISIILGDVSPYGDHKAMLTVQFYKDWDKSDTVEVITPGNYKSYTDPDGVEWRVYVDRTIYNGSASTAKTQICFEEVSPAEGDMVVDIPAEAAEGDSVDLCATIKNVGGTTAKFFLRFYDGSTMVRETLPGNVAPGQTITDVCELFTMPSHAWSGRIDLIRQG